MGQTISGGGLRRHTLDNAPRHPDIARFAEGDPVHVYEDEVPSRVPPGTRTRAGGLLFLIPALEQLGYREWLELQPEWTRFDVARRVLAAVLSRLRVEPEDAAWQLAEHRPSAQPAPRQFVAPVRWRKGLSLSEAYRRADAADGRTLWDASGRLLLGAWNGPCPRALMHSWRHAVAHVNPPYEADRAAAVTRAWLVAARRWLRRFAAIGVSDLVLRPATLTLTPTHVDVCLDLDQAELRIRRVGLDIDPGWVPWFGRVASVRYGSC